MDSILTDSHLGTSIKRCIQMDVIVPILEYAGEVWEGNNLKFVKQLKTVQMTAAAQEVVRRLLKNDEQYSIRSGTRNIPT